MENVLIVSHTDKGIEFFTELLSSAGVLRVVSLKSCGEARRQLLQQDYDLVIVNAPLRDETGERLAREIAFRGASQIMLVVKSEFYDAVSAACEDDGVMTIARPLNRTVFWSAFKLAKSAQSRLVRMQAENNRLIQKIEDIRIVDRAKCILISCMNMSEKDAHRHIEKQAMDLRTTKRTVAEDILKTYES